MEDKEYYSELQSTLRNYDNKLWAIPGLFFGVVGLILGNIDLDNAKPKNIIILFFGLIFLFILLLLFYKAHFFHISIQKKINKFDKKFNDIQENNELKRMPLTSMTDKELKYRLKGLEEDMEVDCEFGFIQKKLIREQVTNYIKCAMWLAIIIGLMFIFLQIYIQIK